MTGRKRRGLPNVSTKASLVVLFVPSVDRDSKRDFCLEMCAATNQGEVGLVIDNRYHGLSGGAA